MSFLPFFRFSSLVIGSDFLCVFLCRHLLYPVTMNIFFKKGLFPTDKRKIKEFYQHFQAYDEGFEYGSQMPECLLR